MTAQLIYYVPLEWQLNMYNNASDYVKRYFTDEEWWHMCMFELFEPGAGDQPLWGSEDFKELMLEKYGVEHGMQVPEFQEKQLKNSINTMLKRYGVRRPMQVPEIASRMMKVRSKNNFEKYGFETTFEVPEVIEKCKVGREKTFREKYGVDNPGQIPKVREDNKVRVKAARKKEFDRDLVKTLYRYVDKFDVKLGRCWFRKKDEELSIILMKLQKEHGTL